jgi:hypothetical protein
MKTNIHFFIISGTILLTMRNVSDKICRENQNKHCVFINSFFFFENRAVYETKFKNFLQTERPQITIRNMRIAMLAT